MAESSTRAIDEPAVPLDRGDPPAGDPHAISRTIQRAMIPTAAPRLEGYEVAAGTTLEDSGRGNSTWDHMTLADGRVALVVLDTRAEGPLPPAHILGMARAALRTALASTDDPAEALRATNSTLAALQKEGSDQFAECGVVVPDAGSVVWASAGRTPAGVLGREGTFRQLASHGPPLGMMDGFGYGTATEEIGVGDALLVLSGGSAGLFRGASDLVAQVHGKPAGEIVGTVHRAIRKVRDEGSEAEEISVIYLRRH
ncbi:MAG: SpoIIE family protein phosphatase [Longimicrobiales bacterium]|nr:SpoIIE family protein phosphatase [Longimicrobiales bacterium]